MASQSNLFRYFEKQSDIDKEKIEGQSNEKEDDSRKRQGSSFEKDAPTPKKDISQAIIDEKWKKQHKWLVYDYDINGRKMTCSICTEAAKSNENIMNKNSFTSG